MKNKLEQLLNSLIEKGWKPNGLEKNDIQNISYDKDRKEISIQYIKWCTPSKFDLVPLLISLRELVSKESGLWQFVCENGMVDGVDRWTLNARQKSIYDKYITSEKEYTPKMSYEYRLIESALKDESELEEFLLNSIVINND